MLLMTHSRRRQVHCRLPSLLVGVGVYGPDATHELEGVLELGVLVLLRGDVRRATVLLLAIVRPRS